MSLTWIWPYGLSSLYLLAYLPLIIIIGSLLVVLYRLTFHPLTRFPGPTLAASTGLYEAYYQCIKNGGGRYWAEIQKMHQQYGPIVRINPYEVHISDPEWNAVYKYSSKASKPPWFYFRFFGKFPSTNVAESHTLHQLRRAPLQTYFASSNIQRYIPTITAQADKLCARLRAASVGNSDRGENIVSLSDAFRCLATDVATGFAFGTPFGHLDEPSFDREFNSSVKVVVKASMWSRHMFGLFLPVLHSLPESIARRMNPAFKRVMWMKDTMINCVQRSMNKSEPAPGTPPDMIQTLMASDLPPEEKTFPRLFSESRSVIMAGTETTATTSVCITSNLLGDPAKVQKLRHELCIAEKAKGGALDYADLRELPYITGVINEGLRLANPTPSRLPRVCEDQELTYKQWVIPRGTTISTTTQDTHNSPLIFTNPSQFLPERWADPAERRRLNKYLQPWGRGSRLCLGTELATIDVYLAVSRLFGPSAGFDMQMYDTVDEDWVAYHEWFAGFPKGRGLRVRVIEVGKENGNGNT
ncbi:putative cytochrome P450 [Annulohypoxylon maeteangense]|uniref:putative cytochrome P450 n=1 Tax=Annulohypoxylon maeteangense TaxID=1927788 RepID=UPI002007A391|nr:putative cytochrome P450 [Annulohypoxylon maeteangense]KAI0886299.1 putative cytochrome P450 [Annulohypoxylon maeteangense]